MLGAIVGDMAGSTHEFSRALVDEATFPLFTPESRFTDDSVLTLAVARGVMQGFGDEAATGEACARAMRELGRMFPRAGYGGGFRAWLASDDMGPYGSMGNGSAMRVSSVGWACDTLPQVERYAAITAEVTHNHPEGVRGAKATACAVFMARRGAAKDDIRREIESRYGYALTESLDAIRRRYMTRPAVTCQETVPEALTAFLASENFEDAIRKAVALGGDTDTLAAIAGSVAEAFYGGVPDPLRREAHSRLDPRLAAILETWDAWRGARTALDTDA